MPWLSILWVLVVLNKAVLTTMTLSLHRHSITFKLGVTPDGEHHTSPRLVQ